VRFVLPVEVAALEARDGYVSDISRGCATGRSSSASRSTSRNAGLHRSRRFFELGYADDYGADVGEGWQDVERAILETPGALDPAVRRAIFEGNDPPELAALLDKVRRHAYRITDADVKGLETDVVIEGALAAALGEALRDRQRALEALA